MRAEELMPGAGTTTLSYDAAMNQRAPLPQGHPTDTDLAR